LSAREATDALQGKLRERTTQERCALQESYKTMRALTSSARPSSDGTTHVPGEKFAAGTCLSMEGFRLALDKLGIPLSDQDSEEAFRALHADGGVLPIELAQFLINVINSGGGVVESTASDTATEDSAPWASGEQAATASAKRAVAPKLAAEAEQGGGGGGESSLTASWTDDELDQNLIAALEQRLSIKKGHMKHQGKKEHVRGCCAHASMKLDKTVFFTLVRRE
jgi:hypothetical protein